MVLIKTLTNNVRYIRVRISDSNISSISQGDTGSRRLGWYSKNIFFLSQRPPSKSVQVPKKMSLAKYDGNWRIFRGRYQDYIIYIRTYFLLTPWGHSNDTVCCAEFDILITWNTIGAVQTLRNASRVVGGSKV